MKIIIKKNYQDGFSGLISTAMIKFTEKQAKCSFDLQSQVIAHRFGVAKARIQAAYQLIPMVQSKKKNESIFATSQPAFSSLTLLWTLCVGNGGTLRGLDLPMSINDQDSSPQGRNHPDLDNSLIRCLHRCF